MQAETHADFEPIFQEYWPKIYRVLFQMVGDVDAAEDLALEVFVRLHDQPRLFGEGHNVGGWLYRVATNLGYNALRAAKRRKKYERKAGLQALAGDPGSVLTREAEQAVERTVEREQVRRVLAQMKPRDAKLLLLRHSGLSYAELAETLGVAPGSVGTLLARATRAFEKQYRAVCGGEYASD